VNKDYPTEVTLKLCMGTVTSANFIELYNGYDGTERLWPQQCESWYKLLMQAKEWLQVRNSTPSSIGPHTYQRCSRCGTRSAKILKKSRGR